MKNKFTVKLNTIDRVKEFSKIVSNIEPDLDIIVGRYVIDAKSIMGIFSIDLSREVVLVIHSENESECAEITEKLKKFIVEGK